MADHVWWGAANVPLTDGQIAVANLRGAVRLEGAAVRILEVYCLGPNGQSGCRRPWDDVAGEPCIAAENNEHLRGGPIGKRRPRKCGHDDCVAYGCSGAGISPKVAAAAIHGHAIVRV